MSSGSAEPLDELLRFEGLLADLSAAFVVARADEVDELVTAALERVVGFLDLDRSAVARFRGDGTLEVTHSWGRPGVELASRVPIERFAWYTEEIRRNRIVVAARLPDDLPADAFAERDYVQTSGLKAQLTLPLTVAGERVGGIGFGGFRHPRPWPEAVVRRMRLVADVIGGALARKKAEESLRRSEARLHRILQSMPAALVLMRADGSIAFANEAASRMFGVRRAGMLDLPIESLVPALDAAARTPPLGVDGGWDRRGLAGVDPNGARMPLVARLNRIGSGEREVVCLLRPAAESS